MSALASLDDFLDSPAAQRDLTRALRHLLFEARSLVLVYGDASAAAALVATLARTWPVPHALLSLVETRPLRVTARPDTPDAQAREVPGADVAQVLRALLRQDPDAVALAEVDAGAMPVLFNAVTTGHACVVGTGLSSPDAFLDALAAHEPGLRPLMPQLLELAVEVVTSPAGAPRLSRVLRASTGTLVEVARADGPGCALSSQHLPAHRATGPRFTFAPAPPLSGRPAPRRAPRPAFVVHTGADDAVADGPRHRLGARRALRPDGGGWPRCRECEAPLAHVVQLDLSRLPEPLAATPRVATLFVCAQGCDTTDERAPGVLAELLPLDGLTWADAPDGLAVEVEAPGPITRFERVDEDPAPADEADEAGGADAPGDDGHDEAARPLRCDKVGGWPAWEQGADWPTDDAGARFRLLFQWVEGLPLDGGLPAGWDFEAAECTPGQRPRRVVDPDLPRHFHSLLTGDAVGLLFWSPDGQRLAFRWQTG